MIDFAGSGWRKLHPHGGRLERFVTPRSLAEAENVQAWGFVALPQARSLHSPGHAVGWVERGETERSGRWWVSRRWSSAQRETQLSG